MAAVNQARSRGAFFPHLPYSCPFHDHIPVIVNVIFKYCHRLFILTINSLSDFYRVPSNPDEEQGIEMDVLNQDVDKWEIAPSRIILQDVIGAGSFGAVCKANLNAPDGRARRMPVAAKCFTRELNILNSFPIITRRLVV